MYITYDTALTRHDHKTISKLSENICLDRYFASLERKVRIYNTVETKFGIKTKITLK